jgi:uncharacterized membrane protein YtjA (UPF0391 family)
MFSWAIAFLVIALIAAAPGFGGVAGTADVAAKLILFAVATVAFPAPVVLELAGRPR